MTGKLRLAPHLYNKMLGELMGAVMTYGQTQQLRTHLAKVVDQYVEPDHPHTRSGCTRCGGAGQAVIDHGELGIEHMVCPHCNKK